MDIYIGILVVETFLPKEYFDHYLTYVIAIILLKKEKVETDDILSWGSKRFMG